MLTVLFFARYREVLQQEQIRLEFCEDFQDLAALRQHLAGQGGAWEVLNDSGIMCARNQELVPLTSPLCDQDEVAFFPTVTGG